MRRLAGLTGGQLIGEETRLLLELPAAENPLVGAGESCFPAGHRGKVLILWTRPEGQAPAECTVKPGTSVFLFSGFAFCDPVEPPPFFAVGEEAQRRCAVENLLTLEFDAILVTVDGRRPVDIGRERFLAVSPQGTAQLPEGNILGVDPQETTFVTAGYVAMLRPLRPGKHTITVEVVGGPSAGITSATVNVVPTPEHTRAQGLGRPGPSARGFNRYRAPAACPPTDSFARARALVACRFPPRRPRRGAGRACPIQRLVR